VERRILIIIETILKAEGALAGLAKIESTLQALATAMKSAGLDEGLEKINRSLMNVGEGRRHLEALSAALSTAAGAAPQVVQGTKRTEAAVLSLGAKLSSVIGHLTSLTGALGHGRAAWGHFSNAVHGAARVMTGVQRSFHVFMHVLRRFSMSIGRMLQPVRSLATGFLNLLNPLTYVRFGLDQFFRVIRIASALLLFQAIRKLEEAFMALGDAVFGANARISVARELFVALIDDADRASGYLDATREIAIRAGVGFDELAEATVRFSVMAGENFGAFQTLVKNTVALAFFDKKQGLHGAGMAVMEALEGNFRSLVRRFEIGSLQMVKSMREMGKSNFEILQQILEDYNITEKLVERVADTWTGAMRQVRGSLGEFARLLGEPIFEFFEKQLLRVRDYLMENYEVLGAIAYAFGTVLLRPIQDVAKILFGMTKAPTPDDFFEWGSNLLYGLAEGIIAGTEYVIQAVVAVAQVIADFLMALSPPKRGPLRGIYEGGMNLIREWIRGMEAADLGAITNLAQHALAAFDLMMARGKSTAFEMQEFGMAVYESLTLAVRQILDTGRASQGVLSRLRDLFGELYGDVEKYLKLYTRIAEAEEIVRLREEEVETAEAAIEAQEAVIDGIEKQIELARENLELAEAALEAFKLRTEGIPARFLRQRERELEAVIRTAEAEVEERESRLKAAQEELELRREDLEVARDALAMAEERVKAIEDELSAHEAQMSFMQKLWAFEKKAIKEREKALKKLGDDLGGLGIDKIGDAVENLGNKIKDLADVYIERLNEKMAPLRERWENILSFMTAFFTYEPEKEGLYSGIDAYRELLGRDLTEAEAAAFGEGWKLRDNIQKTLEVISGALETVKEFAMGFFGIGEGETEAWKQGENFRKEVDKFWKETLKPLLEDLALFAAGLAGIGVDAEKAADGAYIAGEGVRELGGDIVTFLGDVAAAWAGLPSEVQGLLLRIFGIVGVFFVVSPIVVNILKIAGVFKELGLAAKSAGLFIDGAAKALLGMGSGAGIALIPVAILGGTLAGPLRYAIDDIILGFSNLVLGFLALISPFHSFNDAWDRFVLAWDRFKNIWPEIKRSFEEVGITLPDVKLSIDGIKEGWDAFLDALGAGVEWMWEHVWGPIVGGFQWVYDALVGGSIIPELIDKIVGFFKGLPGKIVTALGKFGGFISGLFGGAKDESIESIEETEAVVPFLEKKVWKPITEGWEKLSQTLVGRSLIPDMVQEIIDQFWLLPPELYDAGRTMVAELIRGLKYHMAALQRVIDKIVDILMFWDDISGFYTKFYDSGKLIVRQIIWGMESMIDGNDSLSAVVARIVAIISIWALKVDGRTLPERAYIFGQKWMDQLIAGIESRIAKLKTLLQELADLMPASPAKTGPLSVPVNWDFIYEGLPQALAVVERGMAGLSGLRNPVAATGGGGSTLLSVEITNYWDASISSADRAWIRREMEMTTYQAITKGFHEAQARR
jgi:hypothetical protein